MSARAKDTGAAAVEFALVVPLLLALTLGIIGFGHAFHVQTVLDNAARDAVRIAAIGNLPADAAAETAAQSTIAGVAIDSASASVAIAAAEVDVDWSACRTPPESADPRTVRVSIEHTFGMLGGLFGDLTLTGQGTMRCNG
ncbi:TadE-like protein [Agrococcus baldri]|uniref:TadE-like protein n=1 Tax=Agrococcus baldri TaxID=153730 RepID=A0AA94HK67_9MICO|nr:TadE family protein [Agrococcus baldri]SFR98452.1 TadE-like protein [Agrococcus baldri]